MSPTPETDGESPAGTPDDERRGRSDDGTSATRPDRASATRSDRASATRSDRTSAARPDRTESASPSYDDHSIAVVVPAYNEVEHVGEVLDTIPPFVDRIYAVDDRSTDGTWAEIRRRVPETDVTDEADADRVRGAVSVADGGLTLESDDGPTDDGDGPAEESSEPAGDGDEPADDGEARSGDSVPVDDRIVPIRHEENRGAGAGIRTGYRHAYEDGMDVTVAMDGDGQMDPAYMPDLVDPVVSGEAEYAKGNRLADPEAREEMPAFRLFGNWLLTMLTKVASGYWKTMDPQNGYTAISHEALAAIDIDAIPAGHDYTNDLLVRLNVAGARVADVSMPACYGDEASTIDYSRFAPKTSWTLLQSFLWRLRRTYLTRDFHPLVFFYAVGAAGVGAAVGMLVDALRRDEDAAVPAVGAVLSLLLGCLSVVAAMVLDAEDDASEEVGRE